MQTIAQNAAALFSLPARCVRFLYSPNAASFFCKRGVEVLQCSYLSGNCHIYTAPGILERDHNTW